MHSLSWTTLLILSSLMCLIMPCIRGNLLGRSSGRWSLVEFVLYTWRYQDGLINIQLMICIVWGHWLSCLKTPSWWRFGRLTGLGLILRWSLGKTKGEIFKDLFFFFLDFVFLLIHFVNCVSLFLLRNIYLWLNILVVIFFIRHYDFHIQVYIYIYRHTQKD